MLPRYKPRHVLCSTTKQTFGLKTKPNQKHTKNNDWKEWGRGWWGVGGGDDGSSRKKYPETVVIGDDVTDGESH